MKRMRRKDVKVLEYERTLRSENPKGSTAARAVARLLAEVRKGKNVVAVSLGFSYRASEQDNKKTGAPIWKRKTETWSTPFRTAPAETIEEMTGLLERAASGTRVRDLRNHFYRLKVKSVFVKLLVKNAPAPKRGKRKATKGKRGNR